MGSILYRQIQSSEVAAASVLACEAFDQSVAPHYQPEGVSEFHRYASAEALAKRHLEGHITLVAELSGELVGMLHLREPSHISMLFVRASHQRRGIGRGLLTAARKLVGDSGRALTVSSSPNAVSAYERLGFRMTSAEQCVHGIRFTPMECLQADGRNA